MHFGGTRGGGMGGMPGGMGGMFGGMGGMPGSDFGGASFGASAVSDLLTAHFMLCPQVCRGSRHWRSASCINTRSLGGAS